MTQLETLKGRRAPPSFAVTTVVFRDAFGYMPGGLLLLLLLEWKTQVMTRAVQFLRVADSSLPSEWPGEVLLITLLVLLAYPVGRIAYNAAALIQLDWKQLDGKLSWLQNPLGWRAVHRRTRQLYGDHLKIDSLRPFGLEVTPSSYALIFHALSSRWVFLQRPDLFFVSMTRINTLRVLADTTLGVVLLAGVVLYWPGNSSRYWFAYVLLALFSLIMANRLRREQSRAELIAAFITYTHLPPESPSAAT